MTDVPPLTNDNPKVKRAVELYRVLVGGQIARSFHDERPASERAVQRWARTGDRGWTDEELLAFDELRHDAVLQGALIRHALKASVDLIAGLAHIREDRNPLKAWQAITQLQDQRGDYL